MAGIENGVGIGFENPDASGEVMTFDSANAAIASLNAAIAAAPITWTSAGVQKTGVKQFVAQGTLSGGSVVFHMTENGLSGGTAVFPNEVLYINAFANDPLNTFGIGTVLSNSNKTLTATLNTRTFTSAIPPLLGISVLTTTTLSAAPNGTIVYVHIIGR